MEWGAPERDATSEADGQVHLLTLILKTRRLLESRISIVEVDQVLQRTHAARILDQAAKPLVQLHLYHK